MLKYYYILMMCCCFAWIYLNADTISQQWHNRQRGVCLWLNVFLMANTALLAFMLLVEIVHNILLTYDHFVLTISNLFFLYTLRKIIRRWQLKQCGKDFNTHQCNVQAVAFSKSGVLTKIFNS